MKPTNVMKWKHRELVTAVEEQLTEEKYQVICGSDTNGRDYDSISQMWEIEKILIKDNYDDIAPIADGEELEGKTAWYSKGHLYWEDAPPTVDGMLGGFSQLSTRDLKFSLNFMRELLEIRPELRLRLEQDHAEVEEENDGHIPTRSCECGAGIGRVTKGLLLDLGFEKCDLVETSPTLIRGAPEYIGDHHSKKCQYFCTGLQDFEPSFESYDVVWIQWVVAYLTDYDLVNFFIRMGASLRLGGIIILKDNTCTHEAFVLDKDDSSLTRSLPYLLVLAEIAGLRVVKKVHQDDFPDSIFPVPMIAFEVANL